MKQQQQKATLENFCFKLRNSKCLLVSNRICPLSAQIDQRSVLDPGSPLIHFAPLWVGVGWVKGREDCGALKGGEDMRNPGSGHRTWIPKVRVETCLPGHSLSRCGLGWTEDLWPTLVVQSPSYKQLMISLGPLPRSACAKDRQHALDLVVSKVIRRVQALKRSAICTF